MATALTYVVYFVIAQLLAIGARILFTCAVGQDAKARGLKHRVLFMVFTFISPLLTGIVYLCVRSSAQKIVPKMCVLCGATLDPNFRQCPNCGGFAFNDYILPNDAQLKKSAKNCLIAGIVAIFISTCVYTTAVVMMTKAIISEDGTNASDYSDFDSYLEDFLNQYGDESDIEDEDSSAADDFNNFGKNGD